MTEEEYKKVVALAERLDLDPRQTNCSHDDCPTCKLQDRVWNETLWKIYYAMIELELM